MKSVLIISTTVGLLFNESHAALRSAPSQRKLSLGLIAGYEPSSVVTDHNALDLDQKAMEDQLDTRTEAGFTNAATIYKEGGYSKSYAVLKLASPLSTAIAADTELVGSDATDGAVTGEAYEAAAAGATELKFRYAVGSSQESYTNCHVGGLATTNTAGCLKANGTITASGSNTAIGYTYDVASNNDNGRTLQGFSTNANTKMRHDENIDKPYFPDFQKFFDYYGAWDYADQIVNAGFTGTPVTLSGKTFDFSAYQLDALAEVVAKTTAYMSVAMYTIRELEDSIDDCLVGDVVRNLDAVQALDEAVAFYTGSLEGADGSGSGVFMYSLAEKRCINFKTCGENGDQIEGNAKVNIEIFEYFNSMQVHIANKDCEAARSDKEVIARKMFIPIIQGALRYAWKQTQPDTDAVGEAEGAIFSAAVLPMVASCNADAAATIYNEMKPNSGNMADFSSVKSAFESTYKCMQLSCEEIGGLYDGDNNQYYDGAGPCGSSSSSSKNTGLIAGLTIGGIVIVVVLAMFTRTRRSASQVEFKGGATTQV